MGKIGRTRKLGSRQPNGQLARDPRSKVEREMMAVAERNPERSRVLAFRPTEGARPSARQAEAGSSLGRLKVAGPENGGITADQYDAGQWYAGIVHRWSAIMGLRTGNPTAAGFDMGGGMSIAADPSPEAIAAARSTYQGIRDVLAADPDAASVLHAVCVLNRDELTLLKSELYALRSGLNALHRVRMRAR